jgi:hypothetical protein
MNKQRYKQIIDEVYNKYLTKYVGYDDVPSKELFLFEIKNNTEFSERWGLKIEEKELSLEERNDLLNKETNRNHKRENCFSDEEFERETLQDCKAFNIPTKLITLTYNNETIEVYE